MESLWDKPYVIWTIRAELLLIIWLTMVWALTIVNKEQENILPMNFYEALYLWPFIVVIGLFAKGINSLYKIDVISACFVFCFIFYLVLDNTFPLWAVIAAWAGITVVWFFVGCLIIYEEIKV